MPERIVENSVFEDKLGLSPGEIAQRTGLLARRHADPGTAPTDLGLTAAEKAISESGLAPGDIDMIISAATSRDQSIPTDAMIYAHRLGLPGIQCLHLEVVCLSFLNALEVADMYIRNHRRRNVLIISSEVTSRVIDYDDPASSFLLADGAAAAVITESADDSRIVASHFRTEALGKNIGVASQAGGGLRNLPSDPNWDPKMATFHVNGPLELKLAIKHIPTFIKELLSIAGMSLEDVDHVIPHQVVPKMISSILSHLGLSADKLHINTEYGNMAAASIPVILSEAVESGKIKRGDTVVLFGGAAGFSLGGVVLVF